jgi:hypothetical protein
MSDLKLIEILTYSLLCVNTLCLCALRDMLGEIRRKVNKLEGKKSNDS